MVLQGVKVGRLACHDSQLPRRALYSTRKQLFGERAGNRARTDDLLITNQLLYQLSYAGKAALDRHLSRKV